jgi:hypothetical protein
MKQHATTIIAAAVAMLVACGLAFAQAPVGAEARLKALNIVLPPEFVSTGNFVNSVQTGKLLFLSGNPGAKARSAATNHGAGRAGGARRRSPYADENPHRAR